MQVFSAILISSDIAEFTPVFVVEDHILKTRKKFLGNFTFTVVGGGVDGIDGVRNFTKEEIDVFNYRIGRNLDERKLIWTAVNQKNAQIHARESTGELVFQSSNPLLIIFECQIFSPCGSVSLLSQNPSEFYLLIEVSNIGVDSSTNCDFTMRFMLLLVGLDLNPISHLVIMLVTVTVICVAILSFYLFGGKKGRLAKCLGSKSRRSKRSRLFQIHHLQKSSMGSGIGLKKTSYYSQPDVSKLRSKSEQQSRPKKIVQPQRNSYAMPSMTTHLEVSGKTVGDLGLTKSSLQRSIDSDVIRAAERNVKSVESGTSCSSAKSIMKMKTDPTKPKKD